ncbi:carboxypeptidase A2 [Condylostylus longicornis]|uniref:carboxypeptidase A2 n=1 Tax=Condylostylus longicornis TaxID=2530218 RepID=UPI00244E4D5A|nr:carboxypeptidase A2 [Condylostylus longicornis]
MNIIRPDILNNYLRHVEVNSYLDYLGNRYKSFVSVYTIGKSYEGRIIKAIKKNLIESGPISRKQQSKSANIIKSQSSQSQLNNRKFIKSSTLNNTGNSSSNVSSSKSARNPSTKSLTISLTTNSSSTNDDDNLKLPKRKWIVIEGGTHAREWTSITVALYCIYQLTEKFCRNIEILQKVKFLIIPLVNSDGYEYSRLKNRRWRKNRKPNSITRSIGTDCNRNYDIHWENGTKQTFKCTYRGDTPFSEPETRAIKHVLERLGSNLIFYLSLHSCAQAIMYPWGYTRELPETWSKLHNLAEYGKKAIQYATGRKYRCGSISQVTNRTYSGSIADYAFGIQKVPYAIVMELPSKKLGFQPPQDKLQKLSEESWIGIKAMCQQLLQKYSTGDNYVQRCSGNGCLDMCICIKRNDDIVLVAGFVEDTDTDIINYINLIKKNTNTSADKCQNFTLFACNDMIKEHKTNPEAWSSLVEYFLANYKPVSDAEKKIHQLYLIVNEFERKQDQNIEIFDLNTLKKMLNIIDSTDPETLLNYIIGKMILAIDRVSMKYMNRDNDKILQTIVIYENTIEWDVKDKPLVYFNTVLMHH